jgi:hypothetical protein
MMNKTNFDQIIKYKIPCYVVLKRNIFEYVIVNVVDFRKKNDASTVGLFD